MPGESLAGQRAGEGPARILGTCVSSLPERGVDRSMAGPGRGKIRGVIEIADAVIAHAVQLERSYGPPVLELRIDSPADRGQVADRARAAIARIAGEPDLFWSADDEPAGVVVRQWGHATDIGATLSAFSRALDVAGVAGRPEVPAREPAAAPPLPAHCR